MRALELQRDQLIASEDVVDSQIAAMDVALNDLGDGKFCMGEYHYSLVVFGDDVADAGRRAARAGGAVGESSSLQMAPVDLVADAAWFAQMPGNWQWRPRDAKLSSRAFMVAQRRGTIVNVTSGAQTGLAMMSAYAASKGGVASLTYTWAPELREHGVRVNALSPLAATRMADTTVRYRAEAGTPRTPKAQWPAEASAPLAVYLLSDAARDVTGQVVRIEGHQLSLMSHPAVAASVLVRDGGWNLNSVDAAFKSRLSQRQFPVGMQGPDPRLWVIEPESFPPSA